MTADAPAAAAHPVRFALPVVAALTSAGVLVTGVRLLFGYAQVPPGVEPLVLTWLAPITIALMLTAPAAAVALRPALGRAGGWPITAAGLAVSTLVIQTALPGTRGDQALGWFLVVLAGFAVAVGGLLVAAAQAPTAERIAIAGGVAIGFADERYYLQLLLSEPPSSAVTRMAPYYLIIVLAMIAAALASLRGARAAEPQPGPGTMVAVLVVVAVSGLVQLGHYLRQLIVDEYRLSPDGLASQRRIDAVESFSQYSAIALAAGAGLVLLWLGFRRGKADLARWVALGFALAGPGVVVVFGFYYSGPTDPSGLALTALLAIAAGIVLALRADRLFAWETLGITAAAIGMMVGSVSYRLGGTSSVFAALLITGGFAFAFGFGLIRAMRTTTGTPGQIALSLSLGLVAFLTTADALAPVAWAMRSSSGFEGFRLTVPFVSLAGAAVILLLFGFRRAVDRVRREIREQAAEPPR